MFYMYVAQRLNEVMAVTNITKAAPVYKIKPSISNNYLTITNKPVSTNQVKTTPI